MQSGRVQRPPFRPPYTSGVIQKLLRRRVHYKLTGKRSHPEMADPTKARLRPALRLGGVFGFIGGFLLAYQRSSCESAHSSLLTHGDNDHANAPCHELSPLLGVVREQT